MLNQNPEAWVLDRLVEFLGDEAGATAIEYAMIASLISGAILTAVVALGSGTDSMFGYIMSKISPALTGN